MSVFVLLESIHREISSSSLKVLSAGYKVATALDVPLVSIIFGKVPEDALTNLGEFGVQELHHVEDLETQDSDVLASIIFEKMLAKKAVHCLLPHHATGLSIAPRLAVKLDAGLAVGVTDIIKVEAGKSKLKKNVYSGKAIATFEVASAIQVWTMVPGSFSVIKTKRTNVEVSKLKSELLAKTFVIKTERFETETVPLPQAERVVSAGRGLGGPEHWNMIEVLAQKLNAALACSRPVADSGWRPHHEHVGQTGTAIRPNLYIAIAISGATQHLAGVNGSKIMVVINNDPEAPFFKVADYGIIGDAFDIVPKLIELLETNG